MDGFQKIELADKQQKQSQAILPNRTAQRSNQPIIKPMRKKNSRSFFVRSSKPLAIGITMLAAIAVLLIFVLVLPAKALVASAKQTEAQLKVFETAVKHENIGQADTELQTTKTDLADTESKLHALSYLQFIPIASGYYNDANHVANAGNYGLDTAQIVIDSLKPYADVLGLEGQGSFVGGTAQQRISTAVMTMGKIVPRINDIASNLDKVQTEVDAIDKNHYPSWLFGNKIQPEITQLQTFTDESVVAVSQARPLISALPALLGESDQKKYLVIFQNDKELRATGGFITAYAIFDINQGSISVERSDDIYPLDDSIVDKPPAPAPLVKYLHLTDPVFNLRDSNLSPDFMVSMQTFKQMYAKAAGAEPVDGIIAIDTNVLVTTIKILDNNVVADGQTFTTNNDPRCDCANVIYELEDAISRPVNYIKTDRKGLLGDLLDAIMHKALSSSPKVYWGPLFQSILTNTNQKHILFDLYDQDAQSGIEALNAAGQIQPFNGDYLAINDVNFGGDKANLFTTEAVESDYSIANDGTVTKTITVSYDNNHAPSDCSLADGGLCLNSDLRDWVRIYVPKGSTLVSNKGSEVKMTTYDDLGKTVFDGYIDIHPLSKATYSVTYTLPFKLQSGSSLPLLIQKQPGTYDNNYTIVYNNNTLPSLPLLTDVKMTLK